MPYNQQMLDIITIYRSKVTELACTCDPWQVPSLGEAFFDHLEAKKAIRGSGGKSVLPDDVLSFNTSIALPSVVQGWPSGAGGSKAPDASSATAANPGSRRL